MAVAVPGPGIGHSIRKALEELWAWLSGEKARQADLKRQAEKTRAEAARLASCVSMSAPGLEKETASLTSTITAFKQTVDPAVDLAYAKKLVGQAPGQPTPGVTPVPPTSEEQREQEGLGGLPYLREPTPHELMMASGVDPEVAASTLAGQGSAGMLALALAHTPGIIAEAASLGQMESVIWTVMDLLNASGLPDIVKASKLLPYEVAVLTSARYHYQAVYRPMQPEIQELPRMLARGLISPEEYLKQGGYLGLDDRWAAALWNCFLRLPEWRDLQVMLWRGLIDDTGFKDVMLRQGWHPDVVDEMLNLAWQIPGPGDLIRFVVREVISPSDFITWMRQQGFGPGWAGAYWTAHFVLPSPRDLIDAYHRGLIDEAELAKFIFWHDYMPEARPGISKSDLEIMKGLTKTLIPRVDLRRAWALGAISDAELKDRYELLGYEEDSELMAEIQKTVALTPQINAVATQYLAGLRKGLYSEDVVRARLKDLKLPSKAIDLLVEIEHVRRAIGSVEPAEEPRVLTTAQILAAYKKRLFPAEAASDLLLSQGWPSAATEVLIALNSPDPEVETPLREVGVAAAALYREGFMTPEEFEGWLRSTNFSDDDIYRIRLTEDLRARLDYLKDLQSMLIEAYKKDVFSLAELRERLLILGMQPERAQALIEKEAYKKLPKPKAAA